MSNSIERAPLEMVPQGPLTSVTLVGTVLKLKDSAGGEANVDLMQTLATLEVEAAGIIAFAVQTALSGIALTNPIPGTEKNGDVKVVGTTAFVRQANAWRQVWPR